METNLHLDREEQINPNCRHTTVETDTEESENETVTNNQIEEEEDISRLQNPEQERTHQTQSWFS
jgi:hypothetical protein